MNLSLNRFMLSGAIFALLLSAPALADEVTEEEISIQDLPAAVASTVKSELGGKQADEVEKVSYEGIVVLYEAEYVENGEEHEVYVYPSGELVARHTHEEGEEEGS